MTDPPILSDKHYDEPSVFTAENMLREARRQKALESATVPPVCVLDPDGDIVRALVATGRAQRDELWACYHTDLYRFTQSESGEAEFGIIGCAVGAAFAVLVAEELFACGCRLLISITSSGQIVPLAAPPYFILIERALRDEGTSYHYLPPTEYSDIYSGLLDLLTGPSASASTSSAQSSGRGALEQAPVPVYRGATWTTDAPFRETATAIERCRKLDILAVEMEAAALYAFARAREKPVVCFASDQKRLEERIAQIRARLEVMEEGPAQ